MKYKCEACEFETDKPISMCWHIRKIHKVSTKEYYLKYILKQDSEPKCKNPECNNVTRFVDFTRGYLEYCSKKCHNNHFYSLPENIEKMMVKMKNNNVKKYGVAFASQLPEVKKKMLITYKNSMIEKYGTDNPMHIPEFVTKLKATNLEKYGVDNPLSSKEIQEKIKDTNLNKYGVEYPMQLEILQKKRKETNLNKYGVEHFTQTELYKIKSKQTLDNKSIEEKQAQKEKTQKTNLEKYGGASPANSPEIIEKMQTTCLERYGVSNPMDDETISKRWKENLYKRKEFVLPSGKIIKLQGYEPEALSQILKYIPENDIEFDDIPYINYTYRNKILKYYPDLYIKSLNLIIEVKSTYVLKKQGIQKNEEKFKACKEKGFNFLLILDNNFEKLEKYLKHNQL